MDKQQATTELSGNYIQYPVISHYGKEYEKEYTYIIYIYIHESLGCTAEIDTL